MASLNRAAWLPSKVTKLRSGKIEHRPGMGQETVKTNRCPQGEGCLGTQGRCLGLFLGDSQALGAGGPYRAGVIQRSAVVRVRNLPCQDHTETRDPTGRVRSGQGYPDAGGRGHEGIGLQGGHGRFQGTQDSQGHSQKGQQRSPPTLTARPRTPQRRGAAPWGQC